MDVESRGVLLVADDCSELRVETETVYLLSRGTCVGECGRGGEMVAADPRELLSIEAVPPWAKIPYITQGYRRIGISIRDCIRSAFRVHNETVNFWSHFIPSLVFLCLTPYIFFHVMKNELMLDRIFMLVYMLSVTNCMVASSCFHLFGCRSRRASLALGHTDFRGITLLITASYAPALSVFFRPYPFWQRFYLTVTLIVLIKALVLVKVFADRGWVHAKNYVFVFDAAWGLIPTVHFTMLGDFNPELDRFVLGEIVKMYGLYLLGFVIYSARVPERFCPGKTDVVGQSHHLWHVFVLLAAISWLVSLIRFYRLPIP